MNNEIKFLKSFKNKFENTHYLDKEDFLKKLKFSFEDNDDFDKYIKFIEYKFNNLDDYFKCDLIIYIMKKIEDKNLDSYKNDQEFLNLFIPKINLKAIISLKNLKKDEQIEFLKDIEIKLDKLIVWSINSNIVKIKKKTIKKLYKKGE